MTVSSSASTASFPGNGVTTVFPLPFRFFSNSDVEVSLLNVASGVVTPQSIGTNYTLSGAGDPEVDGNANSTLTMLVAPPPGVTLIVERVMDAVQQTDIINQARFFPEIHENVFDRLVMLIQQNASVIGRALLRPIGKDYFDALGYRIANLHDPIGSQDAATMAYVQQAIAALLEIGSGSANNAANVLYVPNGPNPTPLTVQNRLRQAIFLDDYKTTVVDGVTSNQVDLENALLACTTKGADLFWPDPVPRVSTSPLPTLHTVRHVGPGAIKADGLTFYVDPKYAQQNVIYMAPGGTGDGLSPSRPLNGFNGTLAALKNYAPLKSRWTVEGSAGTYFEDVQFPNYLASSHDNYLAWNFPAPAGLRAEPGTYPAILSGIGNTALTGFHTGIGNRMTVNNLCVANFYDNSLTNVRQVRRGIAVGAYSTLFLVNCASQGNGLSNLAALPSGTLIITGGRHKGSRYGIDNTAGRCSMTATTTTYAVVEDALEYGLYEKHDASTVSDYTEWRNNGKHPAAVLYGAAIFAYKSNASVDTRGNKFYANNICWNARGGFVADNPDIPDVYGTGVDANTRRFLCRGGGGDDLQTYRANRPAEISTRYTGGSTTSTTDVVLLNQIAEIREGYLANNDQSLRIRLIGRAQVADALITPQLRVNGSGVITLGTYRITAGKYGEIRLVVRPNIARTAFSVEFSCTDAVQNLGAAVGQIITTTTDLTVATLQVEVAGRADAGGTASFLTCMVDLLG
ncbi:tail spike protein [Pseudomonas phage AF]|uniref:tail spike protein n=1 Tax=Pseudomonas phage AF TaxID=1235689 RepID=UPI0002970110|nr:tail spike protein [Pseudomonas phage AF]AFV50634.1 putative tail spike protein [Pseudomonas phage AF]